MVNTESWNWLETQLQYLRPWTKTDCGVAARQPSGCHHCHAETPGRSAPTIQPHPPTSLLPALPVCQGHWGLVGRLLPDTIGPHTLTTSSACAGGHPSGFIAGWIWPAGLVFDMSDLQGHCNENAKNLRKEIDQIHTKLDSGFEANPVEMTEPLWGVYSCWAW